MGRFQTHESTSTANTVTDGAQQVANQAENTTREAIRTPWFGGLVRVGYAAKGLVYIVIGWLALMTAVSVGGRTTDPQGAITTIYAHPFGKFLLFITVVGFVGYALWQFARAIFDPDAQERDAKEAVRRIGYAVVGVSYLGFALAALRLMTQNVAPKGSNTATQDWTARLMSAPGGVALVVVVGLIVLGVAIGLFYEAWKLRFERYFPLGQMNEGERKLTRYHGPLWPERARRHLRGDRHLPDRGGASTTIPTRRRVWRARWPRWPRSRSGRCCWVWWRLAWSPTASTASSRRATAASRRSTGAPSHQTREAFAPGTRSARQGRRVLEASGALEHGNDGVGHLLGVRVAAQVAGARAAGEGVFERLEQPLPRRRMAEMLQHE